MSAEWDDTMLSNAEIVMERAKASTQYVPTLGQYAEVIAWLTEQVDVDIDQMPESMHRAYRDALHRAGLRRVAQAMAEADPS